MLLPPLLEPPLVLGPRSEFELLPHPTIELVDVAAMRETKPKP
jgi:hypothetical protein